MKLTQFGDDIWITDEPVPLHTDSGAIGLLTYGFILVNTGYVLIYNGRQIEIPPGSIYEIDGNVEHETRGSGLLAILIWDMSEYSLDKFKAELRNDARKFCPL